MRRKIYRIWQEFSLQMNEHHISAYASSAAFFTFLSLIPMLLLLISAIHADHESNADDVCDENTASEHGTAVCQYNR